MGAVNAAVDIFYTKVLKVDLIKHFFKKIDMTTQAGKLKMFLAFAFGAPTQYSGKQMKEAHSYMNLTEAHFNAVAVHLVDTLQELSVPQNLIEEVVVIAMTTKDDIFNS